MKENNMHLKCNFTFHLCFYPLQRGAEPESEPAEETTPAKKGKSSASQSFADRMREKPDKKAKAKPSV